ncbi:MAG: AAA-like domain-containing protein [Gemmatimonadetes bacterium]|nr:AAA-like domain-containing protein [Gemmatimonadota bacterium]
MLFFNTAGPIKPEINYYIPPLERLDLDEVLLLIEQQRYFVMHAPRQTGKTSALLALRDELNGSGQYRCVYVNVEIGQSAREDVAAAIRAILGQMALEAEFVLSDLTLREISLDTLEAFGPHQALQGTLSRWAAADDKPLVLLIDEIDALIGDTLLAVLRHLRAGYPDRPQHYPQTVVLCGVRDVRDYRIQSTAENAIIAGGSAFNIRAESLRLGDFSPDEVQALLAQHTETTGQVFAEDAQNEVWRLTQGQPWLVNALAYEACFRNKAGRDRSRPITAEAIRDAREQLILRRETHLDQLTDKLQEERVRRVVEPLLSGAERSEAIPLDDVEYVRDLGLIARRAPIAIANPIYQEVIPRDLTYTTQEYLAHDPAWYVDADGRLRLDDLLTAFQAFFREHSEHWVERFQYKEAGPQLLLQAFLQRIVNSGGRIEREYGLGRMRTDLLIAWPVLGDVPVQRVVIECKLLYKSLEQTILAGLDQTRAYMDRCGVVEGHLVIFDRTAGVSWDDKIFRREEGMGAAKVTVWGM